MLDGFQYLEERDASDEITRAGVVSKKSAFVSPENAGIYDAIAKDLRLLAEAATSLADDADLQQILAQVKSMYDDMRTNPNFGSTAAKAQAEEALKQAQAAAESAAQAKEYGDKATSVAAAITAVENYLETIESLEKSVSDNATIATNKASAASASAANAATSATNAKTSETNAASSASAANASQKAAAASQTAAKTSETNAANSATAAASSQTAAKTSETNAKSSETSAKAWAVSTDSPDGVSDSDSSTGKTQSSRTWALLSKAKAEAATNTAKDVQTVMNDAVAQLKEAFTGASKLVLYVDGADEASPIISRFKCDDGTIYNIGVVRAGTSEPLTGVDTYFKEEQNG